MGAGGGVGIREGRLGLREASSSDGARRRDTSADSQPRRARDRPQALGRDPGVRRLVGSLSLSAAGVAHETKNPLGIIRGLAQRIEQSKAIPDEERERAGQIVDEADRAGSRLGEFLAYARLRGGQQSAVAVAPVLDHASTVLREDFEAAGVALEVKSDSSPIVADRE